MSTTNNREDWRWFSLFDPKTGNNLPAIEGGFGHGYEVEEEYEVGNVLDEEEETEKNELGKNEEDALYTYGDNDDDDED